MARILVVTSMYPPHHYGGYELSCFDTVERWRARGHDVHVLTSDLRIGGRADGDDTGVTRTLPIAFRAGDVWRPPLRSLVTRERAAQRELANALDGFRPEVVSVWQMGAMPFGLLTELERRAVPIAYVVCDDWLIYGPTMDPWMRFFADHPWRGAAAERVWRVHATLPDIGRRGAFCFVSDFTRQRAEHLSRWSYPVSTVTYSGIATTEFPPAEPTDEWRERLLFVGRMDERKGAGTAIAALAHLPDAELTIVSRVDDRVERERLAVAAAAGDVGDRIRFASAERDGLAAHYRDADVFLFPSEWPEPFGLVPLEAMACRTPVVATGVGGSGEFLVNGGNCVLVPPGDPHALATAVRRLRADPLLRRTIVDGGSATVAQLDVEALATTLEAWHLAAAAGFADGVPAARSLLLPAGQPVEVRTAIGRHQLATPAALATGDPSAIKQLYVDLGELLEDEHRDDPSCVPVLSNEETHPVVVGLLDGVHGRVLDAGCGPNPAVSITLHHGGDRAVVAMDIALGIVRLARTVAADRGAPVLGVVGDVEHLPFRDRVFDGLVCDDTIEHVPNDRAAIAELARVTNPRGRAVFATPNRHSLVVSRAKLRDRVRGHRRPSAAYYVSSSHLREYSWREFESLTSTGFRVEQRAGVGWTAGRWRRRLLSRLVRLPIARHLGQMIVVAARPADYPPAYNSSYRGPTPETQS